MYRTKSESSAWETDFVDKQDIRKLLNDDVTFVLKDIRELMEILEACDGSYSVRLEFEMCTNDFDDTHGKDCAAASPTHKTFRTTEDDLKAVSEIFARESVESEARMSRPIDASLESWPPAVWNVQPSMDKWRTRVALIPAPPETTLNTPFLFVPFQSRSTTASIILQLMNLESLIKTYDERETATAPPRTATLGIWAPWAEQLKKLLEKTLTPTDIFEPGTSTANAPPAL
jgi:hypothetical protein